MRVLVCSPPPSAVGGIAAHSQMLCERLPGAQLFDQWWPLRDRGRRRPTRLLVHGLAFARLVRTLVLRRPDVIHLQVSEPGVRRDTAYAKVGQRLRVPVVAHLHSEFREDELSGLEGLVQSSSVILALGEGSRARILRRFSQLTPDHVVVVRNAVPPLFLAPPSQLRRGTGPLALLMVGVLSPLKNQVRVSRVVGQLRDGGLDVRLRLVGPPAPDFPTEHIREIAETEGVTAIGVMRGEALRELMDRSDALVLFSSSEGEPLVVLEAMARGLPVVASDVGAVRSMLPPAEHNYVVRAGDEAELAAAVASLAEGRSTLAETGETNRREVERTRSVDDHLRRLEEIYVGVARPRERAHWLSTRKMYTELPTRYRRHIRFGSWANR